MSPTEYKVLDALGNVYDGEFYFLSFRSIALDAGIEPRKVRRAVRSLARQGFAEYRRGLWSEDGEPRGSGYGITKSGLEYLDNNNAPH